ncbi:hypothetical protein ES703_104846 [subsurface metagenome]
MSLKEEVTWRNGYHTIMISNMINFIFPVRFGEVLKLYIINKVSGASYPSSISSTLSDKFSHLLCMLIFLLFTPLAGFEFSQWSSRFVLFFILFLILLSSLFIFGIRFLEFFERCINGSLSLFRRNKYEVNLLSKSRLISFCQETLEKINISSFTKGNVLTIVLLSFIIISLDGICYYFIIKAFGVPITWVQGCIGACFMQLMFILPSPPAQVGTAEMYPVLIFSFGLGLSSTVIPSAAILWHLLTTIIFIMLGFCSALSLGLNLGSIFRNVREERIDVEG